MLYTPHQWCFHSIQSGPKNSLWTQNVGISSSQPCLEPQNEGFYRTDFFLSNGFREIHVNPQVGARLNIEIISGDELTRYIWSFHTILKKKQRKHVHTDRALHA